MRRCFDKNVMPADRISAVLELFVERQWWVKAVKAAWPWISMDVQDILGLDQVANSFANMIFDFGQAYFDMSMESRMQHSSPTKGLDAFSRDWERKK